MKEGFTIVDTISITSDYAAVSKVETLVDKICSELDVYVSVGDNPEEFCFTVRDQGRGFDFEHLPDPTSPENIEKENGRGIFLMRSLADEVEFDDKGCTVNIYFRK